MAAVPDIEVKVRIAEAEIRRLGVRDGDVLVVAFPDGLDHLELAAIKALIRAELSAAGLERFGVLVTSGEVEFSVVGGGQCQG